MRPRIEITEDMVERARKFLCCKIITTVGDAGASLARGALEAALNPPDLRKGTGDRRRQVGGGPEGASKEQEVERPHIRRDDAGECHEHRRGQGPRIDSRTERFQDDWAHIREADVERNRGSFAIMRNHRRASDHNPSATAAPAPAMAEAPQDARRDNAPTEYPTATYVELMAFVRRVYAMVAGYCARSNEYKPELEKALREMAEVLCRHDASPKAPQYTARPSASTTPAAEAGDPLNGIFSQGTARMSAREGNHRD